MPCKICKIKPVIKIPNSPRIVCKKCFLEYFEKKVRRTIRVHKLIAKKDIIAIGLSGGKDSLTCLDILSRVVHDRKRLIAITIDEGIKGYRNKTLKDAKKFCKENSINLKIFSYKKEFNYTLDEIIKILKVNPCMVCGVFRRYLLNKKSRELGADILATGHNLDDECQSIMMNQFKGNLGLSAKLGPKTGIIAHKKFIGRIKPLYFMTEKEVRAYAFLKNFEVNFTECPNSKNTFRSYVYDILNLLEDRNPGTKHSILQSFLEILPLLKERYKDREIKTCKQCSEPSAKEICRACEFVNLIKLSRTSP